MSATKFLLGILLLLLLLAFAFPGGLSHALLNVHEMPEPTVTDMVMRSRQVAPAEDAESGASIYTVVLLVAIVSVGGAILFMYFGADFLKQLRLTRRIKRRRPTPRPQARTLQPLPQLPMLQEVDRGG